MNWTDVKILNLYEGTRHHYFLKSYLWQINPLNNLKFIVKSISLLDITCTNGRKFYWSTFWIFLRLYLRTDFMWDFRCALWVNWSLIGNAFASWNVYFYQVKQEKYYSETDGNPQEQTNNNLHTCCLTRIWTIYLLPILKSHLFILL